MEEISTTITESFIARWKGSGASERANYQLFLTELCELLGVEKPRPASDKVHEATYTFERPVVFNDGEGKTSTNFIDLYKKAEQLGTHRKQQQKQYPKLTITDMYNVLEKLRLGEALNAKEQKVHEQGLVSILLQLHQELDTAVAAAYGWPADLPEEEILERLVILNKERAAEEARGLIRWLRPEYQNSKGTQSAIGATAKSKTKKSSSQKRFPWPRVLAEQAQAVQRALNTFDSPVTAVDLYHQFKPVKKAQQSQRIQKIDSLLQTLCGLGLLRQTEEKKYIK